MSQLRIELHMQNSPFLHLTMNRKTYIFIKEKFQDQIRDIVLQNSNKRQKVAYLGINLFIHVFCQKQFMEMFEP